LAWRKLISETFGGKNLKAHRNVYRGWFPVQPGAATWKEGIDLILVLTSSTARIVDGSDLLREATPLPAAQTLPGWRTAVAGYYRAMERVAGL
jgi:isopenicillin N synthase-like dioxygenase